MRILLWHGWLLEGTGSNVYTAKVAEVWRRQGHEVLLMCQQADPDRFGFVDAWGTVGPGREPELTATGVQQGPGKVLLIRPEIGLVLPVFVLDHYEGFEVKRFVDLEDAELARYLDRNEASLRAVIGWRAVEAAIAGHVVPGPVVARRALGEHAYVAKVHGSDLEYAVRLQARYASLAGEGLDGARAVVGASRDVLARTVEVAPSVRNRTRVVPPGVDVERWRPRGRAEALEDASARLRHDPEVARGRSAGVDRSVAAALHSRDSAALESLARTYDQSVPDPGASDRLRALSGTEGPLVGYLGKLIPEKGVERYLEALALFGPDVRGLVVGFGLGREWLTALLVALNDGDVDAHAWLAEHSPLRLELAPQEVRGARGLAERVTFTGRLDHRYAPEAVAAMDVLVVPSTLEEAFGMVAAEGAAAGALPLVAAHSSLAEVAEALEGATGAPGHFSFEPGSGATHRLAESLRRLLALPEDQRSGLREAVRSHVAQEWTWERTADRLLDAASG
jgi:glycosyltransferase involved in cell wall biosynthesis